MVENEYFSWGDCWVIATLISINEKEFEIDLPTILALGDQINIAIFNEEELKNGLYKAQKKGLIKIKGNKVYLSEQCLNIKQKLLKKRGGRSTTVDNLKKILNAKKSILDEIDDAEIDRCEFINRQSLQLAYKKYNNKIKRK